MREAPPRRLRDRASIRPGGTGIRRLALLAFLFLPLPAVAQTFVKQWSSTSANCNTTFQSVSQSPDGGYFLAGKCVDGAFGYSTILLKLQNSADVVWGRRWCCVGPSGDSHAVLLARPRPDGSVLVAEEFHDYWYGSVRVRKLGADGSLDWEIHLTVPWTTGTQKVYLGDLEPTADGGCVLVGATYRNATAGWADYDGFVVKLRDDGTLDWQKLFGGPSGDGLGSVRQTSDGGYVVSGSGDPGSGQKAVLVAKLDTLGNLQWYRSYSAFANDESGGPIRQADDGGYYVAGNAYMAALSRYDTWLLRLDPSGNVGTTAAPLAGTWQKTFDFSDEVGPPTATGNDYPHSLELSPEGGLVVSGNFDWGNYGYKPWLARVDDTGNLVWDRRLRNPGSYEFTFASVAMSPTGDSGFLLGGDGGTVLKTDDLIDPGCYFVDAGAPDTPTEAVNTPITGWRFEAGPLAWAAESDGGAVVTGSFSTRCENWDVFTVSGAPASLNLDRGSSATSTVSVHSFHWTGAVSLSCSGLPVGVSCAFAPNSISMTAFGQSLASTMTLSVDGTAAPGSYPFSVVGTSGGLVRTGAMNVIVSRLDAGPNPLSFGSVSLGASATAAVTITNVGPNPQTIGPGGVSSPQLPFTIESNACSGATLPPGGTCSIGLRFAPTAQGGSSGSFTVTSEASQRVSVSLAGTASTPPLSVAVQTPNGGESWDYSPETGAPRQHRIVWQDTSYFRVKTTRLFYTTNGTLWTPIATLASPALPAPVPTSYDWILPTKTEAAAAGQTFPSATARIRVEIEDGESPANVGSGPSAGNFYLVQPTTTAIRTLVVWDSGRFSSIYGGAAGMAMAAKLGELAAHNKVTGVVLDLSLVSAVQSAFSAWDAVPGDQTLANGVASAIRGYLLSQSAGTYTNAQYLILVGDDRQIPFHRLVDGTSIYSEASYPAEVGLDTGSTVGAAIAAGRVLSDDYYAELSAEPTGLPAPHDFAWLDDFAIGRLVETPAEITGTIDAFLAADGQVDLTAASEKILVTGFDFLYDGAAEIRATFAAFPKTVDCLLDDPERTVDLDPCDDLAYSATDLGDRLFGGAPHGIANVNTHADHFEWATSSGLLSTTAMEAPPFSGKLLSGTVLYTSGCHSGLPVPPSDTHPLDLPQAMARKGVLAYLGNTGYGWGMRHGVGLTEELMRDFTVRLTGSDSISIGRALADAKRDYFMNERRYDVFDEKILHEATLYGIPNTLVVLRVAGAVAPAAATPELPAAADPRGSGCADGICVEKSLRNSEDGSSRSVATSSTLPPGLTELDLNFTFGSGTYTAVDTSDGRFYRLNGRSSGEVGDAIQPHFSYNSYLSGTNAHGILFAGGGYTTESGFDPVVAVPRSTNVDRGEGALPILRSATPGLTASFGATASLGAAERNRGGLSSIGQVGYTNMVVHTGVFDGTTSTESRFGDMQFVVYYGNGSDLTRPTVTAPGAGGWATLSGLVASFSVTASDASGVFRVVVIWDDRRTGRWKTLDLALDPSDGKWKGSLGLKGDVTYYVAAVDNAGNVGIPSVSGNDLDGTGAQYGSSWSGPRTFDLVLPDGDADGMPDAFEAAYPCLSPGLADGNGDPDEDGLTSSQEFALDLHPCNGDTDGGGDNDGSEAAHGRKPSDRTDDREISITISEVAGSERISWPAGLGSNGVIDGKYFVYRSAAPAFGPADRINAIALPTGTTQYDDPNPPCGSCYYKVWNVAVASPPPSVVFVSPGAGSTSGGTVVDVYGSDFESGATVRICGTPATGVVFLNPSRIRATTPAHAAGACDVKVRNPNGQEGSLNSGFQYQ